MGKKEREPEREQRLRRYAAELKRNEKAEYEEKELGIFLGDYAVKSLRSKRASRADAVHYDKEALKATGPVQCKVMFHHRPCTEAEKEKLEEEIRSNEPGAKVTVLRLHFFNLYKYRFLVT